MVKMSTGKQTLFRALKIKDISDNYFDTLVTLINIITAYMYKWQEKFDIINDKKNLSALSKLSTVWVKSLLLLCFSFMASLNALYKGKPGKYTWPSHKVSKLYIPYHWNWTKRLIWQNA